MYVIPYNALSDFSCRSVIDIQCMVKRPGLNEGDTNRYSFKKVMKLRHIFPCVTVLQLKDDPMRSPQENITPIPPSRPETFIRDPDSIWIRSGFDPRFDPDPIRKSGHPEGSNPDHDSKMLDPSKPDPDPDILIFSPDTRIPFIPFDASKKLLATT
ncbi:hypothetical protein F2Q69_00005268 [Brassica cretica]|uniref:Uncharacterized protein n=1 Tax=Brassica cretica TaxID=69181 RepID=A0A8S9P815_BRACR|nr:hypothetical protein F2Q69_00005268 [Brassica cretica]